MAREQRRAFSLSPIGWILVESHWGELQGWVVEGIPWGMDNKEVCCRENLSNNAKSQPVSTAIAILNIVINESLPLPILVPLFPSLSVNWWLQGDHTECVTPRNSLVTFILRTQTVDILGTPGRGRTTRLTDSSFPTTSRKPTHLSPDESINTLDLP